ncbi:MAG TPA: hypothetical protein DD672_02275 [Gammaproteobacteria bacterium]|nr:hypothetical protein [Gammaproteobacteria bacterium]
MPAFNHVTRLGTATALLILLGSYVFGASADAAEGGISRINQAVTVDAEQQVGDVSSVNGSIRLARGAEAGEVTTVNGTIELDDGVTVSEAGTVNGGIRLGSDVKVNGELSTVNGGIRINAGSVVAHNVETVNGRVHLESAVIRQNIVTSNGDIDIVDGAIVEGDIIVESRRRWWDRLFDWNNRSPRITVDAESSVQGDIHIYREVKLEIEDGAMVGDIVEHFETRK